MSTLAKTFGKLMEGIIADEAKSKEDKVSNRSTLPFGRRLEIHSFLTTICKALEGGYCEYVEPWSDEAVAKKFSVSVGNIGGIRREIGKLRDAPGNSKEMGEMKARLASVIEAHNELVKRFNHLQSHCVAVNRYRPLQNGH